MGMNGVQAKPFYPFPPEENNIDTVKLEFYLKTLAVSLIDVSKIDNVQKLLYSQTDLCVDKYYHMFYDSLYIKMRNEYETDIKTTMNASIKKYFNYDKDSDYIAGMYEYFNSFERPYRPQICIPHYAVLQEEGKLYPYAPQLGWFFFEDKYPFHCVNCEDSILSKSQAHGTVTWLTTYGPQQAYFVNGDPSIVIMNCTATTWPLSSGQVCQICPPSSTNGGLTDVGTSGSLNQELRIEVKAPDKGTLMDGCLNVTPIQNNIVNGLGPANFAILSKVNGYDYYKRIMYPNDEETVIKMAHPIFDFQHYSAVPHEMNGDVLTLCETVNDFEAMNVYSSNINGYAQQFRYTNAYGGLYAIYRPGIPGFKPVYFAYPYTEGIWFNGSPDLSIAYDDLNDPVNSYCQPANTRRSKIEDYYVHDCYYCVGAHLFLGIPTATVTDYLISTDFSFINSFWSDNVITVGLSQHLPIANTANNNYDFFASNSPVTSCTSVPTGLTTLQTFSLSSGGEYDMKKSVQFNSAAVPVGITLYIQVTANFTNGEYINDTKCVTVNNFSVSAAVVQIRGNIKNYNSSVVNYEIKILKQ